jgi:hypothetical protein
MTGEQQNANVVIYLPDDKYRIHYNQAEVHYILKKLYIYI